MRVAPLVDRAVSSFPVSVGTAMAFETLFSPRQAPYDPKRPLQPHVDVKNYKHCYINLATLYRNICGAANKEDLANAKSEHYQAVLDLEIDIIRSLFANEGGGHCQPIFYYDTYKKLFSKSQHNAIKFRLDKTDIQRHHTLMMLKLMENFFRQQPADDCVQFDSGIMPKQASTSLIITHLPYDLFSYERFNKLDLLESHTGKLKSRNLWYTKYYSMPNEEINTLPFIRKLWYVFGDNSMMHPLDIRFRRLILDISRKRRWTSLTTESKVLFDLDLDIQERYLFDMLKSF